MLHRTAGTALVQGNSAGLTPGTDGRPWKLNLSATVLAAGAKHGARGSCSP